MNYFHSKKEVARDKMGIDDLLGCYMGHFFLNFSRNSSLLIQRIHSNLMQSYRSSLNFCMRKTLIAPQQQKIRRNSWTFLINCNIYIDKNKNIYSTSVTYFVYGATLNILNFKVMSWNKKSIRGFTGIHITIFQNKSHIWRVMWPPQFQGLLGFI